MPDCCVSKSDFLASKAHNFRAFLELYEPDVEVKQWLSAFDETLLLPTIMTVLVPLQRLGKVSESAKDLCAKLKVPKDKVAEVTLKIERYLNMFVDIATH